MRLKIGDRIKPKTGRYVAIIVDISGRFVRISVCDSTFTHTTNFINTEYKLVDPVDYYNNKLWMTLNEI